MIRIEENKNYRYGVSQSSPGVLELPVEVLAWALVIPAEAAAVVADELARRRLVVATVTGCCGSGGDPDRLRSPILFLLLAVVPQLKFNCWWMCELTGSPSPVTPTVLAATIDFFLPVAPKLKNLHNEETVSINPILIRIQFFNQLHFFFGNQLNIYTWHYKVLV